MESRHRDAFKEVEESVEREEKEGEGGRGRTPLKKRAFG